MDERVKTVEQDDEQELSRRLSNEFYLGRKGGLVPWAHWGVWSRLIAGVLRPRQPSVLVLSLPRSGSSWVGCVLGGAPDALYLREPITRSDPAITQRNVFNPDDHPELRASLESLSDRAFSGLPSFRDVVVYEPEQWSLRGRLGRRVVIKEINPRACRWFVERYRPRVIMLLRHPAAATWSALRHGWIGPSAEEWAWRGRDVGETLRQAREALSDAPEHAIVTFESLCTDPLAGFRSLYDFAGLRWSDSVEAQVVAGSRVSRRKIDTWRSEADPECIEAMRRTYRESGSPWYQSVEDW